MATHIFALIMFIIVALVALHWWLDPKIDYAIDTRTDEGWCILWYGHRWRRYIRLFKT
jgi:hypothetical protein